jgi:hypothetical protein
MGATRPCALCRTLFVPGWPAQALCSDGCAKAAQDARRLRRGGPLGQWRTLADHFIAGLEREEQQLAHDARRAQERGLHAFAKDLTRLRDQVAGMCGDTRALLWATRPHPCNQDREGART